MPPFKIFVDSRFRVETGGHNSDTEFTIELPRPLQVQRGLCYIDSVILANSFYTIRANENDRIYVKEIVNGVAVSRIATIAPGQYLADTLAIAVKAALDAQRTIGTAYTVTWERETAKLHISNSHGTDTFAIYATDFLKNTPSIWNAVAPSNSQIPKDILDAGAVIGFSTGGIHTAVPGQDLVAPAVVNVQPYNQLFIRCSTLGVPDHSFGADGSTDIVRRVAVNVGLNDLILDMHGLPHDSVPTERKEITSISFKITDVFGKVVDTKSHPVSFSIIFLADE